MQDVVQENCWKELWFSRSCNMQTIVKNQNIPTVKQNMKLISELDLAD